MATNIYITKDEIDVAGMNPAQQQVILDQFRDTIKNGAEVVIEVVITEGGTVIERISNMQQLQDWIQKIGW